MDLTGIFIADVHDDVRLDAIAVDDAAAGCVVLRGCQTQSAAVVELDDALHRAFPKALLADHHGVVVVLQAAGNNFGGTGAALIDQQDAGQVGKFLTRQRVVLLFFRALVALGKDDEFPMFDEHGRDVDGGGQQSAWVEAQINDQPANAVVTHLCERFAELIGGVFVELGNQQIADLAG